MPHRGRENRAQHARRKNNQFGKNKIKLSWGVELKNLDCVRDVKKISNAKRIIDAQGKLKIDVYIIMYSKSGGLIYIHSSMQTSKPSAKSNNSYLSNPLAKWNLPLIGTCKYVKIQLLTSNKNHNLRLQQACGLADCCIGFWWVLRSSLKYKDKTFKPLKLGCKLSVDKIHVMTSSNWLEPNQLGLARSLPGRDHGQTGKYAASTV